MGVNFELLSVPKIRIYRLFLKKGLRHGDLADFLAKLSWKLVVANLIHSEHFL